MFVPNSEPSLIQIATILPGQKLSWHCDTFLYQQFSNKIHIPLFTNDHAFYDVFVRGNLERINMTTGRVWNINNLDLHRSVNNGDTIRSHLIIDFIDVDVLKALDETGINYFHHNLPEMGDKSRMQLASLREWFKESNQGVDI